MMRMTIVGFGMVLVVLIASGCTPSSPVVSPTTITPTKEKLIVALSPSPPPPTATRWITPEPTIGESITFPSNPIPHLTVGQSVIITTIHMIDASNGWAIGNAGDTIDHILSTNDGGNNWQDVTPPEAAPTMDLPEKTAVGFFLDRDIAWVTYSPATTIWRTNDGGQSWLPSQRTEVEGFELFTGANLHFIDTQNGWLMRMLDAGMSKVYMAFYRTNDGGVSWDRLIHPSTHSELQTGRKTGMSFADAQTGWVTRDVGGVMDGAFIDWTHDGGFTWESQQLPLPEISGFCGMYFPALFSAENGSLALYCSFLSEDVVQTASYIATTVNAGQDWILYEYPGGELYFINQNVVYALGREIYRSENGGQTWTMIKTVNWDGQFSFIDENLAWAVARAGDEIALVKTENGCRTWQELKPRITATQASLPMSTSTLIPEGVVPTPMGGGSGQIAFISYRGIREDMTSDIYLMNIDGSGLTLLTDVSRLIENFTWSPDGEKIAFDSFKDGDTEIYVINADGSGLLQLTDDPAMIPIQLGLPTDPKSCLFPIGKERMQSTL